MSSRAEKVKDPSRDKRTKSKAKKFGGDRHFSDSIVEKTLDDAIEDRRKQMFGIVETPDFEPEKVVIKSLPKKKTLEDFDKWYSSKNDDESEEYDV